MKWSVERTIIAGFGLALFILIAVGAISNESTLSAEGAGALRWVAVGGSALALAITLLALALVRRELARRRQAEAAAAKERNLLQALMDNLPDTIYFKDRESRFTRINRAQAKVLGVPEPAAAYGKTDFDFQREDVSRLSFDREQEIMATGQPLIDWIESVPNPDGSPRWFSSTKVPIRDAAGQVVGLVGVSRDVTEHQQTQAALEARVQERTRLLRMLSECNQTLVRADDEASLLNAICHNIVTFGGYRLAWVGLAEPDAARTIRPVAQAGVDDEDLAALNLTWAETERGRGPSGAAIRTGQPVIARDTVNDTVTDPALATWRDEAVQRGYASSAALPFGADGGTLGVLNVYAAAPDAFDEGEVALLAELAGDVAFGLGALRTRAALRRSDALLAETSRISRVGGWELDLITQTLYWSEETYRIHEVDPSVQPDLASGINFYAPEARPVFAAAVQKASADGTPWDLELPFITATGRRLWVRAQGQAEVRDGKAVRLWGAFQDITERKQADEKIQRNAARAEALSQVSKALVEVSTDYREVLDTTARLLAELIGDGCSLYLASPDSPVFDPVAIRHRDPEAENALRALLAVTPARVGEGVIGRVYQTGQGVLIPNMTREQLQASVQPEYWDFVDHFMTQSLIEVPLRTEGRTLGVVILLRNTPDHPYSLEDQTLLQEVADRAALVISNARLYADLEQRVRERTQSLETANQELEAFSYSVSHDLRAPLRALDGFSQILLEDYADQVDATGRDYLQRVRTASQKMAELIDALLTLARLTRAEVRRETVNLTALAQATMADLQAREPERPVSVFIAQGLRAEGDPRLLRAVLENLLTNAWKFTGKTPNARIEFGCLMPSAGPSPAPDALGGDQREELVFFVRDNGAGFDMAHADKLFGAFQRLHGQAEFAGTGVGLATVQRILHRHGGRVWATGEVGQGATFYFALPSRPAPVPVAGPASLAHHGSGTEFETEADH